ncbi:MAG: CGNR zinc finger domain-containing protein [Actinobacteria bacterium]|nr:CGNR zinc finger domain-containing protein [Actinomycetota bacterium]
MDYDTFTGQTVSEAVALANLFALGEPDPSEVRDVLRLYGLRDGPVDLAAFGDLAGRIRAVFEAGSDRERVELLNALLSSYEPTPFIADHDGQGPHFHFVPDDGADVRRVGASLTMALAHVVVDYGGGRLGRCPAPRCPNVFVDTTRNRSQRYCSKTCATRVHVAEHRARH